MKILIHFEPNVKKDIYEASRLRKNIKGALELNNIAWVNSIYDSPDVCHILSPDDYKLAKDAKGEGIPLVISALYCEGDPSASFTTRTMSGELILTGKALRVLEIADVILTPSKSAKEFLAKWFPLKNIEVITPGVNSLRFEELDPIYEGGFRHYERFQQEIKYFITIGEYDDKKTLNSLRNLALLNSDYLFFFIGGDYGGKSSSLNKMNKKNPKNLRFLPILPDDLYRSAVNGAQGFIYFDTMSFSSLVCLEILSSKTPIFKIGDGKEDNAITNSFISVSSVEEFSKTLSSITQAKLEGAIMSGYRVANGASLKNLGAALKKIYDSLL